MSKEVYNLQVQISTDLKEQLKTLAKEDDRSLRTFCRRILEDYVNGIYTIDNSLRNENMKSDDVSDNKEDNKENNTIDFDLNNIG